MKRELGEEYVILLRLHYLVSENLIYRRIKDSPMIYPITKILVICILFRIY